MSCRRGIVAALLALSKESFKFLWPLNFTSPRASIKALIKGALRLGCQPEQGDEVLHTLLTHFAMVSPEFIELSLEGQAAMIIGGLAQCDRWSLVDKCGQSNRAVDCDAAACVIKSGGKVNAVKIMDAIASNLAIKRINDLAVVPVATVHGVDFEHKLGILRGILEKRIRNQMNKVAYALEFGTLGYLTVTMYLKRRQIVFSRPFIGENGIITALPIAP